MLLLFQKKRKTRDFRVGARDIFAGAGGEISHKKSRFWAGGEVSGMSGFSQRLRFLRTQRGLTQQQLAQALGVSKSSVNMYERGEREPGLETLAAMADLFEVDLDELTGRTQPPPETAEERRVRMLARRAAGLPQEEYDRILRNFEDTIDIYLRARGIAGGEDGGGR